MDLSLGGSCLIHISEKHSNVLTNDIQMVYNICMKEHTINVRLSEKTYSRLQSLADEYGLNMSSMLAYLVNERFLSSGLAVLPSQSAPKSEPVPKSEPGSDDYYSGLADEIQDVNDTFVQEPTVTPSQRVKKQRKRH